jgi:hypothetical protein
LSDGPASPGEEGAVRFAPEDLEAAKRFLMLLPDPWSCGRRDAQRLAPLLLEEITAQGWQLDDDLARQLTHNPAGVKNYPVTLERKRIPNLPLREAIGRRLPASAQQGSGRGRVDARGRELCPVHPIYYRHDCVECAMAVTG